MARPSFQYLGDSLRVISNILAIAYEMIKRTLKNFAHQVTPQEFILHVAIARLITKIDESHPLIEGASRISFKHLNQYET